MTDQQQIKEVLTQIQHLPWAGEVWLREAAAIIEESELFGPDADVVAAHDRERRRALDQRDEAVIKLVAAEGKTDELIGKIRRSECLCEPLPEHLWTTHYGHVDPATTHRWEPACPQHSDEAMATKAERDRALATLQRVRDLHRRQVDDDGLFCTHCCESWPCKTIRTIDGKADE